MPSVMWKFLTAADLRSLEAETSMMLVAVRHEKLGQAGPPRATATPPSCAIPRPGVEELPGHG
jgi:hypothetical protein